MIDSDSILVGSNPAGAAKFMSRQKRNKKHNLDSWDSVDPHSGKAKFIPGGGRKSDRSLRNLENKKTQNWDKRVDDWLKENS